MKKEKIKAPFSKKTFNFFIGAALMLASIIYVIPVGKVARVFTYIPTFLFGMSFLLVIIFIYVIGAILMFRNKLIKLRFYHYIGGAFFLLGAAIFISVIYNGENANISNYWDMFAKTLGAHYITDRTIDIFTPSYLLSDGTTRFAFGGGLIGNSLAGLLNYGTQATTYIVSITLMLIGLALMLTKYVVTLIKDRRRIRDESSEVIEKGKNLSTNEFRSVDPTFGAQYAPNQQINNIDNSSFNDEEDEFFFAQEQASESLRNSNLFERATFSLNDNEMTNHSGIDEKEEDITPVVNNDIEPAEENPIHTESVVEEETPLHREQLSLDFDVPQEQVSDRPIVFEEPIIIEPVRPQPQEKPKAVVQEQTPTPKPKRVKWIAPSSDLLNTIEVSKAIETNTIAAQEKLEIINQAFIDFNVKAKVTGFTIGPSVTRFHIDYESTGLNKSVANLVLGNDISRRLKGASTIFEETVPGETYSGLQVPNQVVTTVSFKEIFDNLPDPKKHPLAIGFGKNIQGDVVSVDFNKFPHALLAGTTGSGKSVFMHSIIATLIMRNSPDDLKLIIIDPKMTEMVRYENIPHLLCPIESNPEKTKAILNKLCEEMNFRYSLFRDADGCTALDEYNDYCREKGLPTLPYIIVLIDEYGDLKASCKDIDSPVILLGQKARASGIHMLLATQRPSNDVITGLIKSNLPTHIGLKVSNATESIVILGQGGAEKLLGKGDMLLDTPEFSANSTFTRLQSCFATRKEIMAVVDYLKSHYETNYDPRFLNIEEESRQAAGNELLGGGRSNDGEVDPAFERKYQEVKEWVMAQNYMSMSRIQGECGVGFNRARKLFIRLQQEGIVATESEGSKGSPVLVHDDYDDSLVPTSDELTSF